MKLLCDYFEVMSITIKCPPYRVYNVNRLIGEMIRLRVTNGVSIQIEINKSFNYSNIQVLKADIHQMFLQTTQSNVCGFLLLNLYKI